MGCYKAACGSDITDVKLLFGSLHNKTFTRFTRCAFYTHVYIVIKTIKRMKLKPTCCAVTARPRREEHKGESNS